MALTKFLILAFVLTLVLLRLRRAIRAIRAHLEDARSSVTDNASRGRVVSIDLVRCGECGEAVPQSRTNPNEGLAVCSRCWAEAHETAGDD